MNASSASVAFDPLLPWEWLAAFAAVGALLFVVSALARARGLWWRLAAVAVALAALANPSLVEEERKGVNDVALLVVDDSDSMGVGTRRAEAQRAREAIEAKLRQVEGLEVKTVTLPPSSLQLGANSAGGTRLVEAMRSALADIPRERLAGVAAITDGQAHDVPAALDLGGAPLHQVLAGRRDEIDRRLIVEQAPKFGVVGRTVTMKLRIDDPASSGAAPVRVTVGAAPPQTFNLAVGRSVNLEMTVANPGANVVQIEVAPGPRELTLENNRALFTVNGVRDRLRVLLVSGEPYAGERAWRNLLKSDPAVDLVHFTILRTRLKDDFTPVRELSLIVFPMQELFVQKLREFDLIIFDRYEIGDLITREHFRNIAEYVKGGGALLASVGPAYVTPRSLARTPLGPVLPAAPAGSVVEGGFKPKVSPLGLKHPVTADLPNSGDGKGEPAWGRWFRYVAAQSERGHSLMSAGPEERPLVVLDRVGEGRVGLILSDHLWLWNRGVEGGGPQADLVRRVAHWLMKEPDLEEEALRAVATGGRIEVTRRTLADSFRPVTVTGPDNFVRQIQPTQVAPGRGQAILSVDKPGLYRFDDGERQTVAAVGTPDPLEFDDVRATSAKLKGLVEASNGGAVWLQDAAEPGVRMVRGQRTMAGSDWIGFRRNESYTVTGVKQYPLLPGIVVALLFLFAAGLAWWREGR